MLAEKDARLCPTALKKETWRGQGTPLFPILHLCFLVPSDGSWKAERRGVRQKKEGKEDASDERYVMLVMASSHGTL